MIGISVVRLDSCLQVFVSSIQVELTYGGLLEGSREYYSAIVREKGFQRWIPANGNPPLVIDDRRAPTLPRLTWKVRLFSERALTKQGDWSGLDVVWFSDDFPDNVWNSIQEKCRGIDWHTQAQDAIF